MRRLATALLVLYALAIVAWLVARALWGDRLLALAFLNSFPALPFLLAPAALLLALAVRRPVAWVAALAPILLWLAIFGWRFLPRSSSIAEGQPAVRVMALNVLVSNDDIDAMAAAITAEQPDVVTLAELSTGQDAGLAAAIGDLYPYRMLRRLPGLSYGVGIYSRWPLKDLGSLQTGLGLRSAVADIATPHGVIRFVGIHLRSARTSSDSLGGLVAELTDGFRGREAQIQAVCGYLDQWRALADVSGDIPVIVAGDFNMGEFSDAYRCMGARMGDAFKAVGRGYGFTWPATDARLGELASLLVQTRIDYIFHSRHWRTASAQTLSRPTGSDHRAVVATLRLKIED